MAVCYRWSGSNKEKMGSTDKFDRMFDLSFALHSFDYEPQYQNELLWKEWEQQLQDGKLPDRKGGWAEQQTKSEEEAFVQISGVVLAGGILFACCVLVAGVYSWSLWANQKERTKQLEMGELEKQKRMEKKRLARRLRLKSIRDARIRPFPYQSLAT
ncbi:hypothetical protein M3Y99_00382700 [Aphelenchoides fujianensis]|nr:hypothetical protein M3Y99_00382700 [Aphelenchoides fujianensis]